MNGLIVNSEKAKVDNEDESTGYEEWLRNTEDQGDPRE